MHFFDYFDAGHMLITALITVAALTPTAKDDHILSRIKNIMDKVNLLRKFKKK